MQEFEDVVKNLNPENISENSTEIGKNIENRADKRKKLEDIITVNSCLIDVLKDACEFNMELEYVSLIHSALTVISEKQIESLKLVSDLH